MQSSIFVPHSSRQRQRHQKTETDYQLSSSLSRERGSQKLLEPCFFVSLFFHPFLLLLSFVVESDDCFLVGSTTHPNQQQPAKLSSRTSAQHEIVFFVPDTFMSQWWEVWRWKKRPSNGEMGSNPGLGVYSEAGIGSKFRPSLCRVLVVLYRSAVLTLTFFLSFPLSIHGLELKLSSFEGSVLVGFEAETVRGRFPHLRKFTNKETEEPFFKHYPTLLLIKVLLF